MHLNGHQIVFDMYRYVDMLCNAVNMYRRSTGIFLIKKIKSKNMKRCRYVVIHRRHISHTLQIHLMIVQFSVFPSLITIL